MIVLDEGNGIISQYSIESEMTNIYIGEKNDSTIFTLVYEGLSVNIIGDQKDYTIIYNKLLINPDIRKINTNSNDCIVISSKEKTITINCYFDGNIEDLSNTVKLPFCVSKYATYPKYSAMMSILAAYDQEKKWIYNNFILLWADIWVGEPEYWNDFKFANESIQFEFCPMIEKHKLKDDYFDCDDLIQSIKSEIDKGRYCCLSLDMYDIEEWWTPQMTRYHYTHNTTVFGYDDNKKAFYVADFFKKKYKTILLPYNVLINAYVNGKNIKTEMVRKYVPDETFFYTNHKYEVDIKKIIKLLENVILSQDTVYYDFVNICKRGNVAYGLEYFDRIESHIKNSLYSEAFLDIRPFELIHKMNEIMVDRLEYLRDVRDLNVLKFSIEKFKELTRESSVLSNLVVKFRITKNNKIILRLYEKYMELKEKEKQSLIELYKQLSGSEISSYDIKTENISENKYYLLQNEVFKYAEKKLQNIDIENLIEKTNSQIVKKEYTDNYKYNSFPFERERVGIMNNGKETKEESVVNSNQLYGFDDKGRIILNALIENEYTGYDTLTQYIYLYDDDKILKIAIYSDKSDNTLKMGNLWTITFDNGIPQYEFYYAKNETKNVTVFNFDNRKLLNAKVYSFCRNQFLEWNEKYYYKSDGKIKQIIKENDDFIENIYPKYGVPEYDNNIIKQNITDKLLEFINKIKAVGGIIKKIETVWNLKLNEFDVKITACNDEYEDVYNMVIVPYSDYVPEKDSDIIIPHIFRMIVYELVLENKLVLMQDVLLTVKSGEIEISETIK